MATMSSIFFPTKVEKNGESNWTTLGSYILIEKSQKSFKKSINVFLSYISENHKNHKIMSARLELTILKRI
jgi:hypothetical protein